MKYYVMGFSQELIIKYKVTPKDMIILQYIVDAQASTKMYHKVSEDSLGSYVWLTRDKILEDLPMLDISKERLSHMMMEIKAKGLIETISEPNLKGSKTFYRVSEKTLEMMSENKHIEVSKVDIAEMSEVDTSYSTINTISNDIDSTINSNTNVLHTATQCTESDLNNSEYFSDTKQIIPKKEYKYESVSKACKKVIKEYTNDERLQKKLKDYLDMRINMWVERPNMALTVTRFRALLKTLNAFDNKIDVINQSIEKQWATFYAVKSKGISSKPYEANVSCVSYTKDEMKDIEKWRKDNNVPTF